MIFFLCVKISLKVQYDVERSVLMMHRMQMDTTRMVVMESVCMLYPCHALKI